VAPGGAAEADEEVFGARQMSGFKDFYQYAWQTRVIAGRGLLDSVGFEFMKEGAQRVFVVTDATIRGTGLVDRIEAGVADGGLEVAGVFDAARCTTTRASTRSRVQRTGSVSPCRCRRSPASRRRRVRAPRSRWRRS